MKTGDTFKQTFIIGEEVYQGFIHLFQDRNPLHTDRAFARGKGFAQEVMHGNILNGFLSYFIGECLPVKDVVIHSQEIKYHCPVYINDVLELHAEVCNISESVGAVEFKYYFSNGRKRKVAKGKIQIGLI